jgi:hypothetical protein
MIGFNTSPNSYAAVLVVLMIVSAGVAIQRRADGDDIAWVIAIAIIMLPALWVLSYTNSRTAFGTLTLAALTLALLTSPQLRAFLAHHSRRVYFASLIAIAILAAAVIGHGVYHGTLFHDSLNFRWRYWSASAQLVKQHPLLGVGWSNFGDHYLAVRLPEAAEEVRDPHNFIVRTFAELGFIGGIILLAWLARTAYDLTRPRLPTPTSSPPSARSGLIAAIAAIVFGGVLAMGIATDWNQIAAYVQLEVARRVLAIGLLAVGMLLALVRGRPAHTHDSAPWLLYALLAALGAFFVHAMMDFVLAEPGPLILFATLLAAALGVRTPVGPRSRKRSGPVIGALVAGSLLWVVAVAAFVIPVADAEGRAHDADDAIRAHRPDVAAGLLRTAFDAIPINADYAYRSATALIASNAPLEQVKAMLASAIERNPKSVVYYLTRAMLELRSSTPDIAAVQRDFDAALKLDPQNIGVRLDYADALLKHGKPQEAAAQFRAALATNEKYDVTEPKRLPPTRVSEIEAKIREIGG